MDSNIAIKVENVSKTFKIPHEKISSVRGAVVSAFKKKSYEEFKALGDVSFEVKKGEFFGIIGRNGSGKSTLLKILAGIYQADKGKIRINGMISPFLELGIGFNHELSGRDNIYLNATVLGLSKKEIDEKFDSIVKFSELERFIDQKLKNYSSGMQVRLAFSVSIHANRDILLMDEVLAVGDSNFQRKCLNEFNKYKEQGKTVILVSHDIDTMQRYCDRALLLREGKIIEIGKSQDVVNEYICENINSTSSEKESVSVASQDSDTARVLNVEFRNSEGHIVNSFATHEKIEIRIYHIIKNAFVDKVGIGLSIEGSGSNYLFGYTTESDNFIVNSNKGYTSLIFEKFPLLKGSYYVNVTLYNLTNKETLDYRPKIKKFEIFSFEKDNLYRGFLSLEHEWK